MADNPRRVLPPAETGPPEIDPPRHHRSGPFGIVDIGTTKVACLIGRVESDGTLRVLGFGWQKGRGLNSGDITDLEAAEKAIRACVGQAEDMADTRLRSVTVNLTCGQPESRLFNVQWPVGGRAVTENDVRGVLNEGRNRAEADGREPIHVLPLNFAVDATDHVIDPRGLFCTT
jgi:cell division protein FtsA